MATDSVVRRVAQKEVRLFFASPVAWLFLATFAAVALFTFFWVESFFARNIADIRPLFEWMPLLLIFLCAALTMRMWSEERRSGTLEHVLTQPSGLWRFVLGKFRACVTLLVLALLSTVPLPITVALIANLDPGPALAGYLATLLLGSAYLAVGLFVSSRTDNSIVALIGTVALCGLLYLLGSPVLTDFLDDRSGQLLRQLGSGARFESITRGILDLHDLVYYLSLVVGFLALNVYTLERERWAPDSRSLRQRHWRAGTALLLVNLVLLNTWLSQLNGLRLDTTEGRLYSISAPTQTFIERLDEPLLIRGYFSARTHPLLAPLVPQLQDLMREYELAGDGRVQVEFVDPADDPELEEEANSRYDIRATPFQVADRHQSALVNAYFNVLVRYGSEHRVLGFADLIEVRTAANRPPEVLLRKPEFDITSAIKRVMSDYRSGGNLFDGIEEPVEFIAYVSADERLPRALREFRAAILPQLRRAEEASEGRFSVRFIEPEAMGGAVARKISQEWGFRPMVSSVDSEEAFFFYMTLADSRQVVQLPADNFNPADFRMRLDSGLKRFARSFTRTVALSLPPVQEDMARFSLGGPTFNTLERVVAGNYNLRLVDLADGEIAPDVDILAVVAPGQLDEVSIYAIDQFLMRGGTVVLATSPYTTELSGGELRLQDWDSGLTAWLAHHGLNIGETLVLDESNAPFPAPVLRRAGDFEFRDVQLVDYPYFIDLRPPWLADDHPVTANLPQLTMAWTSPVWVKQDTGRRTAVLLRSTPRAWLSDSPDILPRLDDPATPDESERRTQNLGVVMQGRFESWFARREPPTLPEQPGLGAPTRQVPLRRSPESSRIVLFASNDFMDDQVLDSMVSATGTQYLGPLELFMNTLDWSLQDDELLSIRSRGHFNRTLPPMERRAQLLIEYFNYGLALAWLGLLAAAAIANRWMRRRRYARSLTL